MKKIYQNPETIVAELSIESQLLTGTVKRISSGGVFNNEDGITGSTEPARTKEDNGWDDWSDE